MGDALQVDPRERERELQNWIQRTVSDTLQALLPNKTSVATTSNVPAEQHQIANSVEKIVVAAAPIKPLSSEVIPMKCYSIKVI